MNSAPKPLFSGNEPASSVIHSRESVDLRKSFVFMLFQNLLSATSSFSNCYKTPGGRGISAHSFCALCRYGNLSATFSLFMHSFAKNRGVGWARFKHRNSFTRHSSLATRHCKLFPMDKRISSPDAAIANLKDGMTVLMGGFGL